MTSGPQTLAPPAGPHVDAPREGLALEPVLGIPEAQAGDDAGGLIAGALRLAGKHLRSDDVLVVAHKLISKCEGSVVELSSVTPGPHALELAAITGHDPALVQVVLNESRQVLRAAPRVLVTETRHGFVCANAGVDRSNVPPGWAALLPRDPDASARQLRAGFAMSGEAPAVVISDTFGRPFRNGLVNVAIGVAGFSPQRDLRGSGDSHGNTLQATVIAEADELAAAAELLMGKSWGIPAVIVRGYRPAGEGAAAELLRDAATDLFRQ